MHLKQTYEKFWGNERPGTRKRKQEGLLWQEAVIRSSKKEAERSTKTLTWLSRRIAFKRTVTCSVTLAVQLVLNSHCCNFKLNHSVCYVYFFLERMNVWFVIINNMIKSEFQIHLQLNSAQEFSRQNSPIWNRNWFILWFFTRHRHS